MGVETNHQVQRARTACSRARSNPAFLHVVTVSLLHLVQHAQRAIERGGGLCWGAASG